MKTTKTYAEIALSKFIDKVLSTDEPFAIKTYKDSDSFYSHYIQVKYGSAKLVYRAIFVEKEFIFENANLKDSSKYELYAVVADETIYYFDRLLCFQIANSKKCKDFYDYKSEINSYIKETLFPDFYDALKVDTTDYKRFKSDARSKLILGKDKDTSFVGVFDFEVIKLLCGFGLSKENLGNEVLLREKESYQKQKTEEFCIKKCIDTGIAVEDWEIEMTKAVRESKAKFLTVEFEFNGKKAEGKIKVLSILNNLNDKDYFCSYDFDTDIHGQDILNNLGCNTYYYDCRSKKLFCENITKISYRGKAIYERK